MFLNQTIKSLTEDENAMLLVVVNSFPQGQFIDNTIIKSYRKNILTEQLGAAKGRVKEEYLPVFSGLCEKLEIKL